MEGEGGVGFDKEVVEVRVREGEGETSLSGLIPLSTWERFAPDKREACVPLQAGPPSFPPPWWGKERPPWLYMLCSYILS